MAMTTKYYVGSTGAYLGGFDGAEPPDGAIEVPFAPENAAQVWDFQMQQYGPVPVDEKAAARAYMAETDWYVTRFVETGAQIPDEVRTRRAAARLLLP